MNDIDEMDHAPAEPPLFHPAPGQDVEGPRIRWAAIIWGAVFAALAAWGLWHTAGAGRFGALQENIVSFLMLADAATITIGVILTIGAVVLIIGLVGIARQLQKRTSPGGVVALPPRA
ncbi:hypothetical protein [uncultured Microbacterium sp.]|uniref:hypothetical protein n=1 Tax=uncultured Microbacterium sp. TaxID=191216 RepID=UPI0026249DE1|nr:hypothetical protein [uncultured Microbacterium sp.]